MTGIFTRGRKGSGKGYGFITAEDGGADWYVPPGSGMGAMSGDEVTYRALFESRGKDERQAEVTEVLTRAVSRVVGVYDTDTYGGRVVGDKTHQVLSIPRDRAMGAANGHKVIAEIHRYPTKDNEPPRATIVTIIGHKNDPGVDVISAIERLEIPHEYPEAVLAEVQSAPDSVGEADIVGRRDLREWLMVTIDGADAKDLDDAVSLTRTETGFQLGVHIADVTHYVKPGTALYDEAYSRGTSVYLADRVIPMLPHKLSNGICSLNPNQDRLALSCVMDVDANGRVRKADVFESVIKTRRRMTYDDVNDIITNDASPLRKHFADVTGMLDDMNALRQILWARREKRGALSFQFAECKIIVDEAGRAIDVKPYIHNAATNLIEEFMLLCNETIAERFYRAEQPFVYRAHEQPNDLKLAELSTFIARFGYKLRQKNFSKDLQKILEKARGTDEEELINRVVLRSLKQARYTAEAIGHFGLGAKYYCHFTSPIRRFPDLRIHGIIKDYLAGRQTPDAIDSANRTLPGECAHFSATERRADEAERDVEQIKKAEYMEDKLGMLYGGVISGVTDFGVFVALPNTVEGLIPRGQMGGKFLYDKDTMRYREIDTGKEYRLGMRARIIVESVDKRGGRITFSFADAPPPPQRQPVVKPKGKRADRIPDDPAEKPSKPAGKSSRKKRRRNWYLRGKKG